MNGKVISFENQEKVFLKKAEKLLLDLQMKNLSFQKKQQKILELRILLRVYDGKLPGYYNDVLYHLNEIVEKELDKDIEEVAIEEALNFCKLLRKYPSPEVFKELVAACYFELPNNTCFTEKILMEIIEDLKVEQEMESYEEEIDINSIAFFQNLARRTSEIWIAVVRMKTATENILLNAVTCAKMNLGNFYEFSKEIIYAEASTEKVLKALLERISQTVWIENQKVYEILETKLYWILLKDGKKVTEDMIEQVLKRVKPKNKMYYEFYRMVIQKFGRNSKIAKQLFSIFEKDEERLGNMYSTYRKKLLLLLNNQKE